MITWKSKRIDAGTQFTVGNSNDSLGAGLDWVAQKVSLESINYFTVSEIVLLSNIIESTFKKLFWL